MKKNYFFRLLLNALVCWALMACGSAQAITCSLTSNGFSSFYDPANLSTNITSASFTMTCTRSKGDSSLSQRYTVQANGGLQHSNWRNSNRAQYTFGGKKHRINYNVYTTSSCSNLWQGNTTLGGTIIFTSSSDYVESQTVNYWGCIPVKQNAAAGTYIDTVTMTPSIGNSQTFPVTIVTPSSCSISTPPGDVLFTYTSFGSSAVAYTGFAATCTATMPYSMALDATGGTLLGLNYTLSLSASSASGTGSAQNYTINGSIAAGQAGTCAMASCTATAGRTLTISY